MKPQIDNPRHIRALHLAAGHFLSELPETDRELLDLLHALESTEEGDVIPSNYTPCEFMEGQPADYVAELIQELAMDIVEFAEGGELCAPSIVIPPERHGEKDMGNAHFIAAVPAILATLQAVGLAIEGGDPQEIADQWHNAQSTIAKATTERGEA
jgi:hypothetical protein